MISSFAKRLMILIIAGFIVMVLALFVIYNWQKVLLPWLPLENTPVGSHDDGTASKLKTCYDGIDNDADVAIDAGDTDCREGPIDNAGSCYDGVDNNKDGNVDSDDPDCEENGYPPPSSSPTKFRQNTGL